jgi:predicted site-specific integrase-resolvase
VVTYKDRLCRFGVELVEWIFRKAGTKLLVLSKDTGEQELSKELAEDLLAITTVFVAKNNGLRSAKNKRERKFKEQLNEKL